MDSIAGAIPNSSYHRIIFDGHIFWLCMRGFLIDLVPHCVLCFLFLNCAYQYYVRKLCGYSAFLRCYILAESSQILQDRYQAICCGCVIVDCVYVCIIFILCSHIKFECNIPPSHKLSRISFSCVAPIF